MVFSLNNPASKSTSTEECSPMGSLILMLQTNHMHKDPAMLMAARISSNNSNFTIITMGCPSNSFKTCSSNTNMKRTTVKKNHNWMKMACLCSHLRKSRISLTPSPASNTRRRKRAAVKTRHILQIHVLSAWTTYKQDKW